MKKLRVILPAILTLAVSTSAAVTGTVAWFTASRLQTVTMSAITAVNPEQGLTLLAVKEGKNVSFAGVGATYGDITGAVAVTHTPDAYLRDASVDVSDGSVHKATVREDGEAPTEFTTQTITTADTKKFNNKSVYYATQFTLYFGVKSVESGYDQCLFLDFGSTVTKPTDASTNDNNLYNSIRFGFTTTGNDNNCFAWAPLSNEEVDAADTTIAQYISKTNTITAHTDDNFVKTTTTQNDLDDSSDLLVVGKKDTAHGFIGVIPAGTAATNTAAHTGGLAVTVSVWFEGTDDDCKNDNFTKALSLSAELKFIMRRVAKNNA